MYSTLSKQIKYMNMLKDKLYICENKNREFKMDEYKLLDYGLLYSINYKLKYTNYIDYLYSLNYYLSLLYKCVDDETKNIIFLIDNDKCIKFLSLNSISRIMKTKLDFYNVGVQYNNNKEARLLYYHKIYDKFFFRTMYNHDTHIDENICFDLYDMFHNFIK